MNIPPDNVIKFAGTKESLTPIFSKLRGGSNMTFTEELEIKSAEIVDELPGDFKRQDTKESKKFICNQ